ncbi:MAG: bifunctional sulfate adenylyltransferase/adenylylsulfate kinase [Desulfobacteraceae bacterium]|jgi:sulfate adenylyltransferase|nr:bifunctional sulfate adenylyltransferase/adenylylsulfate kinase [Desulfobacteraceae bacterium]
MTDPINDAHGGRLVNLLVNDDRAQLLKEIALNIPDIALNDRQLCDLELLAIGGFSPLKGFMVRSDYESVLDRMRLQDDVLWSVPVCLDVSESFAKNLEVGQSVALRDPEGFLLAVMHVEDVWPVDREKEAQKIYETQDTNHPGVWYLKNKSADYYVGGDLEVISLPLHFDFKQLRLTPAEVRATYAKLGWHRIVGFQTRNPLHRFLFEMTTRAMREARANLLLLPAVGMTRPGDFDHYTQVRCYQAVSKHFPPNSHVMSLLPLAMRLSGPRDAILDAIIAKNYGCSHFIVGHDHASPGCDENGNSFYVSDRARKLAAEFSSEIDVEIVPFEKFVYLPFEDEYHSIDEVPEGTQTISMTGSDIRKRIREGRRIPEWATFNEIVEELQKAYPPPRKQGFTVFLTGLSGAGKSTVAKVLYSMFLEIGDRPVTLLDGDIVRQNLSNELNFSKEHRDINVRRIGFVASEITKNRGIAICAPIAPYENTRQETRQVIEQYGGFVEVHVSTPIEECERRDRKGMYAKARAGLIKGFTGVDDPYESPISPELRINTIALTPVEAAQEILLFLGKKGYI